MACAVSAFVALGANLGDAARTIGEAIAAIAAIDGTRVRAVSSLYRTAPVDADGPDFVNAVAELETTLAPEALLDQLLAIERAHGRIRASADAGAPAGRSPARSLDLDLLTWDALSIDTPRLRLPHPRMHARAFVLVPLAEIAPALRLPGRPPLAELLRACADQRIERLAPPPVPVAPASFGEAGS